MEAVGRVVLQAARRRAGVTQAELGRRAGVPQSVVSAYERGHREPSLTSLRRLVQAAGFDLDLELRAQPPAGEPFTGPVGRRLQRRRGEARRLLAERQYGNPAVFGSVARGTDTDASDVDLLVDLPPEAGLLQLIRAGIDLEALLGVKVDLIPRAGLRDQVALAIRDELVPL